MGYDRRFSFSLRPTKMPPEKPAKPAPRPERALDLDHARKRSGVSLDAIASATKISVRFLQAIEAEEFEKLPGGIFTTSYLRQYAVAIGYDENALLAHYRLKMNLDPPSLEAQPGTNGSRRLERWLRPSTEASH